MLYDNGQMLSLYAKVYAATKNRLYKKVVYQTAVFIERALRDTSGAFYSSLDADSRNESGTLQEGSYYAWNKPELAKILGSDFDLFAAYYNVNAKGKWENDSYVLLRTQSDKTFTDTHHLTGAILETKIEQWQNFLLTVRESRHKPRLDDKSLTSWNALTLKGYIDAYKAFEDPHFLSVATKNANFIKDEMLLTDGSLYRNYKNGKANIVAYLEDYATVADAFIDLYQVTLNQQWLRQAKHLTDYSLRHFFDTSSQMFYFTSDDSSTLVVRKIETNDNVIPSSNSITALNLFKLSHYYSNTHYLDVAMQMLQNMKNKALTYGAAASNWLTLYAFNTGKYYEMALVGNDAPSLLKEVNAKYLPNVLVVGSRNPSALPLLENRFVPDQTTIYVCLDGACRLPVHTVEEAMKLMK